MRAFVFCVPLLAIVSGCAFSEDTSDIIYVPTRSATLSATAPITINVVDGRTSNRTRISVKINGYGMDAASIRSRRPVADIVHDAMAAEFTQRGFTMDAHGRVVNVTVGTFYNTYGADLPSGSVVGAGVYGGNAHGTVQLMVSVTGPAGQAGFHQGYLGASHASIVLANGSNAAKSVAAALQDAIQHVFADPAFVAAVTAQPAS